MPYASSLLSIYCITIQYFCLVYAIKRKNTPVSAENGVFYDVCISVDSLLFLDLSFDFFLSFSHRLTVKKFEVCDDAIH